MPTILDVISDLSGPRLQWLICQVEEVNAGGFVTLSCRGGMIHNAAVLDQYTPVVGDIVHALSFEGRGVLILGSNNTPSQGPPALIDKAPIIVNAVSTATYGPDPEQWSAGSLLQGPGLTACWFYSPAVWASLAGTFLQAVEIEMTATSGGPPELMAHQNSSPVGVLQLVPGNPWRPVSLQPGVPTWIRLPIGWGTDLISGAIKGIAIVSSGQSGVYSGTGRVRLTPLSVTI